MDAALDDKLDDLYAEAKSASSSFDAYLAAVRLGEIWNCARSMPNRIKYGWREKIDEIWSQIEAPNSVQPEVLNTVERLERILGFGDEFVFEELAIIVSNRVELDFVLKLFSDRGVPEDFVLDRIDKIDMSIHELQVSNASGRAFSSACKTVYKNWGIPVDHWLFD